VHVSIPWWPEQHTQIRVAGERAWSSDPIYSTTLHPTAVDGVPVPFSVLVPSGIIPSFSVYDLGMRWQLRVTFRAGTALHHTVTVPLDVLSAEAPPPASGLAPSLALLGTGRRHQAWARAAEQTGFALEHGALVRRFQGCTLTIAHESGPPHGHRLVADARMEEVDIGVYMEGGRLRCRDPEHARRLAEATDVLTERHPLASADDRHLRYTVADGGMRAEALVAVARWSEALVTAVLEVRAQLPAPASVAHLAPAFERAAAMLGGIFVPAGMDVWGRRDDVPFSLETRWQAGGQCCTVLTVGSLLPIDGRYHGRATTEAWPAELPAGLGEALDGAEALEIGPYRIELVFPPLPAASSEGEGEDEGEATMDARTDVRTDARMNALVERLEALIAVGRRLSLRDGVYR